MSDEAEVGQLQRQNRKLKVALVAITTLLLIAVGIAGLAGYRATSLAEQARAEAVRALQMAEVAREQVETRSEVESQS